MADSTLDDPLMMGYEFRDDKSYLREEIERVKSAALLGYGALLAHNADGRYDLVLKAMRDPLFPGDKQPG